MAPTVTLKAPPTTPGDKFLVRNVVALDSSYPNPAGYVFTPASFGLSVIRNINVEPINLPAAATWSYWVVPTFTTDGLNNIASFALHLAVVSTGVEVANAVNVSTASYVITVEGN